MRLLDVKMACSVQGNGDMAENQLATVSTVLEVLKWTNLSLLE